MDTDDIGALAADYEFFGEAAGLMDMQVLKGHGIAALSGMGGALLTEAVFGMDAVASFFEGDGTPENPPKPGYRALAQFLFGIAGARAIYHFEGPGGHPAAYGFAGQVAGSAGAGGAMMLYNQYVAPTVEDVTAPEAGTGTQGLGRMRRGRRNPGRRFYGLNGEEVTRANYLQTNGLAGETEVTPVAPYYDRYKVSVPQGSGQAVNGLGQADDQSSWPEDEATPDVGTWIS